MPRLTNTARLGGELATVANAVNCLRDVLTDMAQKYIPGALTVQTGLWTIQVGGTYVDEVDFTLGSAPEGSATVFDVLASLDGANFHSCTGGAGIQIPPGVASVQTKTFANAFLEAVPIGSVGATLRIDVLQVGNMNAGGDATIAIYTGPF